MGRKVTRGNRNIAWIEKWCVIPDGAKVGEPVRLEYWQKKAIRLIYNTSTSLGIFSFPRKNGKSALIAWICLLHLVGPESHQNAQICSAAQSRDQAAIVFKLMWQTVQLSKLLTPFVFARVSKKELYAPSRGTEYAALSADAKTNLGKSPILVVYDELGQVKGPDSALYDALDTAQGAHAEPMALIISTQAPTDADLLSLLIDDALTGQDPTVKVILHTYDPAEDPFTMRALRKANPAMGVFLNEAYCKKKSDNAKRMPSREASYRNLNLNQRISRHNPFIAPAIWKANSAETRDVDFEGSVWAGLDLSKRLDLTGLVYIGQGEDKCWSIRCMFWMPEEGISDRALRDRVPYQRWADEGWIELTPGRSVDYGFVAKRLEQLCENHTVEGIAFDRWRIDELKAELSHLGCEDLPLENFGQGYKSMAPALDSTEAELENYRYRHGNNPVLTWCASNAIPVEDPTGARKLDKSKSTGRIDGLVALVMAQSLASKAEVDGFDDWMESITSEQQSQTA